MAVISFLLLVTTIAILVVSYIRNKYKYWANRNVPFIEPSFLRGNVSGLRKKKNLHQITQDLYNSTKTTGAQFMGMYFFTFPVVLALDLDFIKLVMVKDFHHFQTRGVYYNEKYDPLSAHLFAIEGQKWKTLRKKLTPTFTSGKMKTMFPTITRICEEFKDTIWLSSKEGQDVEIRELLARFTTDVIGNCAFGLECNSLKDPEAEFRKYGRKVFANINPIKQIFVNVFRPLALRLGVCVIPPDVSTFFMKAVKQTIDFREQNDVKRDDFMDLLIEMKNSGDKENKLTVEEIAAQAFLFFLAGFETSSTAMSFALYELAVNQKLQNKARECVQTVLKKHNEKFTYEAMLEMTYITQCINESLRKYPPLPDLVRKVTEDYQVPGSKVVLPKDQLVVIPIYAIQHDPVFYEQPEVYDPERFTAENETKRHSMAFLAFGEGPRNCIGLRFGMMQARIGLAMLLSSFRFEVSSKTSVPLTISRSARILSPVGGIWLKVEKL